MVVIENLDQSVLNINHLEILDYDFCGNGNMDGFIIDYAMEEGERRISRTFVIKHKDKDFVYAYFSLAATSLLYHDFEDVKEGGEPKLVSLPAIEIKMFAINQTIQGKTYKKADGNEGKYSDFFIMWVIGGIYQLVESYIGAQVVIVRATDERAVKFYKNNYFEELGDFMVTYDSFAERCTPLYYRL